MNLNPSIPKVHLFFDCYSINKGLTSNDESSIKKIIRYSQYPYFGIRRSTYITHFEMLNSINHYKIKRNSSRNNNIVIGEENDNESYEEIIHFNKETIEILAELLYKRKLDNEELESMIWLFVNESLSQNRITLDNELTKTLFITQNKILLRDSNWRKKYVLNLYVLDVNDSMIMMDLILKFKYNKYCIDYLRITNNPGLWYWYSFRSKIPYYHVPDRKDIEQKDILEEFANRFTYLLTSLDNLGNISYFSAEVDSDFFILYYFNYLIVLMTGIFDSLALGTKEKYNITIKDYSPAKISLNSKSGKDFLKEVCKINHKLWDHIHKNSNFISLIYYFREFVVHREGFRQIGYIDSLYPRSRNSTIINYITITKDIVNLVKACGYKKSPQQLYNWGIFFENEFFIFLEPYNFSKMIVNLLILFCNKYLILLEYSNFLESPLGINFKDFEKTKLGF